MVKCEPISVRSFNIIACALLVMNIIDGLATFFWIEMNIASEANPIMNFLLSYGSDIFLLVKMSSVAAAVFILWIFRKNIISRTLILPVVAMYGCVTLIHIFTFYRFVL